MNDKNVITDTLEEIQRTGIAHCGLCPEDDDEIDVGDCGNWGEALEAVAQHGIDYHGLPEGEPWTDEMIEEVMEDGGR